jgi:hypothetical protein
MKLQLDTIQKTIKIEEAINLGELFKTLESLLPNKEWKKFSIEVGVIYNWVSPINIPYPVIIPQPYPVTPPYNPYPWYEKWPITVQYDNPQYICNTADSNDLKYDSNATGVLNEGVFNISLSN